MIVPEMGLREDAFGLAPSLVRIQGLDRSKADTPLLLSEPVLSDPGPLAAGSEANAKTGQGFVEDQQLGLAGPEGELCDVRSGKAHVQTGKRMGSNRMRRRDH